MSTFESIKESTAWTFVPCMFALVFLVVVWRHLRSAPPFDPEETWGVGNVATEKLLPEEAGILMTTVSVDTVTYFEGKVDIGYVRNRVAMILRGNPFLAGRLIRNHEAAPVLVFPVDLSLLVEKACGNCFLETQLENLKLPEEGSMEDALTLSAQPKGEAQVLIGNFAIDKDEPLFRVTVIHSGDGSENGWALVVSMSHVIGDGHTYYSILNMLSFNASISSLNPKRKFIFDSLRSHTLGEDVANPQHWFGINPLVLNFVWRFMTTRYQEKFFKVESSKVDSIKAGFQGGKFVSTNDIVTSMFLKFSQACLGFMPMNFRHRIPDLGDLDAGNYEDVLFMCKDDFDTPALIRKAVQGDGEGRFRRAASSPPTCLPGFIEVASCRLGLVTNWSSFFSELKMPGSKQTLHLPCMNVVPIEGCIVFRPQAGCLAVAVVSCDMANFSTGPGSPFGEIH